MSTKTVKKISSTNANELTMVDMAERDAQGRDIISTYATKSEIPSSSGGATKYRHNIVCEWYVGSGSSLYVGSISFSFINAEASNYSSTGAVYNANALHNFLKNKCGMTDDKFTVMPMSGHAYIGSASLPETYYVTSIYNNYGYWYATGGYQATNSNNRGSCNGGYDAFLPSQSNSIVMYDRVEEI